MIKSSLDTKEHVSSKSVKMAAREKDERVFSGENTFTGCLVFAKMFI